jgi:hypothetical protein
MAFSQDFGGRNVYGFPAAERRKIVATANGRGLGYKKASSRSAAKESFAALRLMPCW